LLALLSTEVKSGAGSPTLTAKAEATTTTSVPTARVAYRRFLIFPPSLRRLFYRLYLCRAHWRVHIIRASARDDEYAAQDADRLEQQIRLLERNLGAPRHDLKNLRGGVINLARIEREKAGLAQRFSRVQQEHKVFFFCLHRCFPGCRPALGKKFPIRGKQRSNGGILTGFWPDRQKKPQPRPVRQTNPAADQPFCGPGDDPPPRAPGSQ